MALEIIPNQAINLNPYTPDDCNLGDEKKYCTLLNATDSIYLQFKQTPCGEDLTCLSTITCLNLDANWTYGADGFCHSPGAADNAEMTITPDLLGITKYIQVNFTVTNFTQGAVTLNFDTDPTQSVTANGEYSFYFDVTTGGATNVLKIIADSDFDGCVEIDSIYQLRKDYIAIIR